MTEPQPPPPRTRSRSASPSLKNTDKHRSSEADHEQPKAKKQKLGGGFKWKDKPARPEHENAAPAGRLERGYRERSPPRRRRENDYDERNDSRRGEDRSRRDDDNRSYREREKGNTDRPARRGDVQEKFPGSSNSNSNRTAGKPKSKPPAPPPVAAAQTMGPLILVHVNDRLGTKAEIPCLASDTVKAFKAMVAMKIGRAPHEILIKRQGERPFKDQLTLEDYGVSSGVQLDLELDTGD